MAAESEVVGREQELAAIDAFLDAPRGVASPSDDSS